MKKNKTGHIAGESTAQENYSGLAANSDHSAATEDSSTQPAGDTISGSDDKRSDLDKPASSESLADKFDREAPEELRK
jgi:hypothetical protein